MKGSQSQGKHLIQLSEGETANTKKTVPTAVDDLATKIECFFQLVIGRSAKSARLGEVKETNKNNERLIQTTTKSRRIPVPDGIFETGRQFFARQLIFPAGNRRCFVGAHLHHVTGANGLKRGTKGASRFSGPGGKWRGIDPRRRGVGTETGTDAQKRIDQSLFESLPENTFSSRRPLT